MFHLFQKILFRESNLCPSRAGTCSWFSSLTCCASWSGCGTRLSGKCRMLAHHVTRVWMLMKPCLVASPDAAPSGQREGTQVPPKGGLQIQGPHLRSTDTQETAPCYCPVGGSSQHGLHRHCSGLAHDCLAEVTVPAPRSAFSEATPAGQGLGWGSGGLTAAW